MYIESTFILPVSIGLQFTAALLALRLTRTAAGGAAWAFIAFALFLMSVRRTISFNQLLESGVHQVVSNAELVALLISALMLMGVASISPLFTAALQARQKLQMAHNELERRVEERTLELSQEVAERKQVESELKESEHTLIRAQEISKTGSWTFNPNTGEVEGSKELKKIFGIENEEMELETFVNVVHPDDREYDLRHIQNGIEHGVPWDIEHRLLLKDGSVKWVQATGKPQLDEAGKTTNIVGIVRDITERKHSEESLRKLSSAVQQSPYAVFITDTEGVIEYINSKFTELTGYTDKDAIGQNPRILKSDETPQDTYADLWATIQAGNNWQGEIKDQRKDGSYFWASETIAPITNELGQITHYVATHEDITQRKDAELSEHQARVQAEVSNRAKSDLMANMSHELRTPLNAIIGFSESMKEETFGPVGNDKYREYLDDIHRSGQHLLGLINDILDVSAVEAGALELHEENVCPTDVVEASLRIIIPRANDGRVTVTSSIDSELPLIYVDERRIKQVMLNLLSNAVKFTPEGGDVSVAACLNDDGSLSIAVNDSGVGMDQNELEKALSKFGQVDSGLNRKHEGTGLGLPLTIGLMEAHGGTLEVKSEKGRGTQIKVTFPKDRVAESVC